MNKPQNITVPSHVCHGVLNDRQLDSVSKSLFKLTTQKTTKTRITCLFCEGIHRWPVILRTKGQVIRKVFPCHDVIVEIRNLIRHNVKRSAKTHGPRFNIKISSYQYRKSHCGDKTIVRSSHLHNGISYTGKMTSLSWIRAQNSMRILVRLIIGENSRKTWKDSS